MEVANTITVVESSTFGIEMCNAFLATTMTFVSVLHVFQIRSIVYLTEVKKIKLPRKRQRGAAHVTSDNLAMKQPKHG